jgi:hypothetical protein
MRGSENDSFPCEPSYCWSPSVCSCLYRVSYDPATDISANCEIRAVVIRFLHAKNMSAEEIHRELCTTVYSQNVMSEGTVRQWCRIFKDGRINVRDVKRMFGHL